MSPAAVAMPCDRALRHRPARLGDEGPATPPLRHSVMRCAKHAAGETLHGAFPGVGLASRVMTLRVMFLERDSNPRLSVDETDALPD